MQSIIQKILYFLAIFIPLTFTTSNSELFEFPKFILLLSGSLVILTAGIIDYLYNHSSPRYLALRTNGLTNLISLSILAILATQLIATIFSIHPYTSFWGYYSRFHQGLLTTICYTILYFSATIYLNKKSILKLIKISVGTAFIISLYAIAQRLGIDKSLWIQDVVNRPFSTLGQPNWLSAYLLPNLFFTLYLIQKKPKNTWLYIVSCLILTAILLTKSRSGFIALATSYLVYFSLLSRQLSFTKIKKQLSLSALYFLLVAIFIGTPYTPNIIDIIRQSAKPAATQSAGTQLENGGTESGDIRRIVWSGALNLIKKHPLLGTGPETFAYTYYWERPVAHNHTSEWDYLYNKAHNEYLNVAATTGLLGLLAYLSFHYAVFTTSLTQIPRSKKINQEDDDNLRKLYPVLGATITSFTITNFFGFSVIPVYLLTTIVAALPSAIKNEASSIHYQLDPWYLLLILPLLYPLHLFLADISYTKGKAHLDANQPEAALPLLQNAVAKRPGLDLYHSALGETYAQLGQADLAIKEAELTKQLNSYHLNFYKSRAKIYLTLSANNQKYYELAASELEDAMQLAPTDPKLFYNLGLIYTRLGKSNEATAMFKKSITLKPNYESPYYALTLLYEQTDQKNLIPDLLKDAKTHLATYSGGMRDKIQTY